MKTASIIAVFLINVFMSKKNLKADGLVRSDENGSPVADDIQIEKGQHTFFGC